MNLDWNWKERIKGRVLELKDDERAQMSFALVAVVILILSIFAAAYFARLNREERSQALEEASMQEMNEEVNSVETELESAAEEAGHRAIEKVEDDLLDFNGNQGIQRENFNRQADSVHAVQENTTRIFEEYYEEHYGDPIYIGDQRVRTHLYPVENEAEGVEIVEGEVYVQNGTTEDWVETPVYFRVNRTMQVDVYDNSTETHISRRINISQDVETSLLLLMNQMNEFDFRRVDRIANSVLFTLAYGRVYSADPEERFEVGYEESIFDLFGLEFGLFDEAIGGVVEFLWENVWEQINSTMGSVAENVSGDVDLEDYYGSYENDFIRGFFTDKGMGSPDEIVNAEDIEIAYNLGIILEQMRVFQNFDESLLEELTEKINNYYSANIETAEIETWLGSGQGNRVNTQALAIKLFVEAGEIDDEVFTVGPFLEKYGDHGFMSLLSEEWYGTFFALIIQTLSAFGESIGELISWSPSITQARERFEAEMGYVGELLSFAGVSFVDMLDAFHYNHNDLYQYIEESIVQKWLGGRREILGFDITEAIAEGIIAAAGAPAWLLSQMGVDMNGQQFLYLTSFGPFGGENIGKGETQDISVEIVHSFIDDEDSGALGYVIAEKNDEDNAWRTHKSNIESSLDDWPCDPDWEDDCSVAKNDIENAKDMIEGIWYKYDNPSPDSFEEYAGEVNSLDIDNYEVNESADWDENFEYCLDRLEWIKEQRYKAYVYEKIEGHLKEMLEEKEYSDLNIYLDEDNPEGEMTKRFLEILDGKGADYDLEYPLDDSDHGWEEFKDYLEDEDKFESEKFDDLANSKTEEDPTGDDYTGDTGIFSLFDRTNSNMVDLTGKNTVADDEGRFEHLLRTGIDKGHTGENDWWMFEGSTVDIDLGPYEISGDNIEELNDIRFTNYIEESWQKTEDDFMDSIDNWIDNHKREYDPFPSPGDNDWDLEGGRWSDYRRISFYNLAQRVVDSMDEVPDHIEKMREMEPLFEYPTQDLIEKRRELEDSNDEVDKEEVEDNLVENGDGLIRTPVVNAPRSSLTVNVSGSIHHVDIEVDMNYIDMEGIYDSGQTEITGEEVIAENITGVRSFVTDDDVEPGELKTDYINPFSDDWFDYYMTSMSYMLNSSRILSEETGEEGKRSISVTGRSDSLGDLERYGDVTYREEVSIGDPSMSVQMYTPLPVVDEKYSPQSPLQVEVEDVSLSRNVFPKDKDDLNQNPVHLTFSDDEGGVGDKRKYQISVTAMVDNENTPALAQATLNFFSGIFGSDEHSNYKQMVEGKTVVSWGENCNHYPTREKYEEEYGDDDDYLVDKSESLDEVKVNITGGDNDGRELFYENWNKLKDDGEIDEQRPLLISRVHQEVDYEYMVSAKSVESITDDDEHTAQFQFSPSDTHHEQGYIQDDEDPKISVFEVAEGDEPFHLGKVENDDYDELVSKMTYNFTLINNIPGDHWIVEENGIPFLVNFDENPVLRRTLAASVQMDKLMSDYEKAAISIVTSILPTAIIDEAVTALLPESEYRSVRAYRFIPVVKTVETDAGEIQRYPDRLIPLPTWVLTGDRDKPNAMWNHIEEDIRARNSLARVAIDPKIAFSAGGAIAAELTNLTNLDRLFENRLVEKGISQVEDLFGFEEGYDFMQGAYLEYFIGESFSSAETDRSLRLSNSIWNAIGIYRDARQLIEIAVEVAEAVATAATLGGYAKVAGVANMIAAKISTVNEVMTSAEEMYAGMKDDIEDWEDREEEFMRAVEEANLVYEDSDNADELINTVTENPQFNATYSVQFLRHFGLDNGQDILNSINEDYNETLQSILSFREEAPDGEDFIDWLDDKLPQGVGITDIPDFNITEIGDIDMLDDIENVNLNDVRELIGQGYGLESMYEFTNEEMEDVEPSEILNDLYHSTLAFENSSGLSPYQSRIEEDLSDGDISSVKELSFANQTKTKGQHVELYPFGEEHIPLMINETYTSYVYCNDDQVNGFTIEEDELKDIDARGKVIINTTEEIERSDLDSIIEQLDEEDPYNAKIGEVEIIGRDGDLKARIITGANYVTYLSE